MSRQHSQLETINSLYSGTSKASGQDVMSPISADDPPFKYFQNTSPPGHPHHLCLNSSPRGSHLPYWNSLPNAAPPPSPAGCTMCFLLRLQESFKSRKWKCTRQGFTLLGCPEKPPWSPMGGSKYFHPRWGRRQRGSVRGGERACPLTHPALPPAAPGLTFGPSLEIRGEVP